MRNLISDLCCVAAAGALAIAAVQAQTPTPSDATKAADAAAKADAAYMAAKEACKAKTDGDKAVCLKDAQAARDKAAGMARSLGSSPANDANPPPTKDAT